MRKKISKIKLNKETLRNLQPSEIRQAEGGAKYTFTGCVSICGCDSDEWTNTCPDWGCM